MMHATAPQPHTYEQHTPISPTTRSMTQGTNSQRATPDPGSPDPAGMIQRKGSLSFLRRNKSRERSTSISSTRAPQRKLSKKEIKRKREEDMRRMREAIPNQPPRIPAVPSQPELRTFGGDNTRSMNSPMSNRSAGTFPQRLAQKTSQEAMHSHYLNGMPIPPVPPIPSAAYSRSGSIDPSRPESMAHRGRYSYASSHISTINSPRRVRRRKDPTPYNILIIGTRGSGKSSFAKFLQSVLTLPPNKTRHTSHDDMDNPPTASELAFPKFTSQFVETEVDRERIGVTLWDSEGIDKNLADLQLRDITAFIESKFDDTYVEESKIARAPGFRDTHIHCVFLMLDPLNLTANITAIEKVKHANGERARANSYSRVKPRTMLASGLDNTIDLDILKALKGKTTVVPIISKADTITKSHMKHLKQVVYASLKANGLETLEALSNEDDSDSESSSEGTESLTEENEDLDAKDQAPTSIGSSSARPPGAQPTLPIGTATSLPPPIPYSAPPNRPPNGSLPSPPSQPNLLPFSIISPDPYDSQGANPGRTFPWGTALCLDPDHCDFQSLRSHVFSDWRADLREASRELWYEGWRTSRLNHNPKRHGVTDLSTSNVIDGASNASPMLQQREMGRIAETPTKMQSNQPWVQ